MPNNNQLPVQGGNLPGGFCPSTYQDILNGFVSVMTVTIPSNASSLQVSASKPADTTKPWLQLDSLGRPVRIYQFAQGAWLSLHTMPPGFTMIWPFALPDSPDATGGLPNFDGGDGTTNRGPYSGPMWQIAATAVDGTGTANLSGRAPMGVGTFPSKATITVGQQLGEDLHKLIQTELAPHYHSEKIATNRAVPDGGKTDTSGAGGFIGPIADGGTEILSQVVGGDPATAPPGGVPTDALGHNTLPPVTGVYFLQRTSRLYYAVN